MSIPMTPPDAKADKNGWLPIETAPNNDCQDRILIIGGSWGEPTIVKNDGDWWRYRLSEGREYAKGIPTHWQPLPSPPVEGG